MMVGMNWSDDCCHDNAGADGLRWVSNDDVVLCWGGE